MAILSEFEFSRKHRPVTQHGNANAMSLLLPYQVDVLQPDNISTEIDDSYPAYALRLEIDEHNWYWGITIHLKGGSLSNLSVLKGARCGQRPANVSSRVGNCITSTPSVN